MSRLKQFQFRNKPLFRQHELGKHLIKFLLMAAGSFFLLILATILSIIFFVNPNDYKTQINQHITNKLGREFAIRGNISWSFFPWLGVQAHNIRINNPQNFGYSPFATIKEMNIQVKLLPLFHKEIKVGKIVLHSAELTLQVDKKGKTNWQSLLDHLKQKKVNEDKIEIIDDKKTKKEVNINISEIDIHDATLNWFNSQDNTQWVISKLTLQSQNINANQPFDINLSGYFTSIQPAIKGDISLKGRVQMDNQKQYYNISQLTLNGHLINSSFHNKALNIELISDLAIDKRTDTLLIKNLKANIENLKLNGEIQRQGENLTGIINIPEFNAKQFLEKIGKNLPPMQNNHAFEKFKTSFHFKYNKNLEINRLLLQLDNTIAQGNISISDLKMKQMTLAMKLQKMRVSDYLKPAQDGKTTLIDLENLNYLGSLNFSKEKQVSILRAINTQGKLQMGMLTIDKTQIKNITTKINSNKGIIQLIPLVAELYQGKYSGNITIDLSKEIPIINAKQTFTNINIANLLEYFKILTKAKVTGIANVSSQFMAIGNNLEQARHTLTGKVNFSIIKGVLKGINLEYWLNVGTAMYHREALPSEKVANETPFGNLKGSIIINKGIAKNEDLLLQTSFMQVTGKGIIDLINERLDYLFNAVKVNPINKKPRQDIIPIRVTGPFSKLSIKPDVKELIRNQLKKELLKQTDKLKETIGEQIEKNKGNGWGDNIRKFNLDKLFGQ
ncbi:MAG: hypothetical protein LEGION0398_MBIBDBAK_00608 [Legionellaceae bacterium]